MPKKQWIRIAELERRSKVPRRNIHFYLQAGLLHPPVKTGKTMAYYDENHLKELRYIKSARKRGVPLRVIKTRFQKKLLTKAGAASSLDPLKQPQESRALSTREKILEAGCRLFRQKGYKQAKINDILNELHIGKGSFYFYFSDKKALFLECIPRIFNELFAAGWERIRSITDPRQRLETRAGLVMPVLKEFCAILELSKEAMEEADPKIRLLGEQTYRSIRRPVSSDIEKGVRQGVFKPIDAQIAGTVFIGIMQSLYDLEIFDGRPLAPHVWQQVADLILNGLLKKGAPETTEPAEQE